MADVLVSGLTKKYGAFVALHGVDLDIHDGEFIVFVGPSGSGKSTLLRCIAGLEPIQSGSVIIGDKDVTDIDPADRDLSMVFQNYALFPHMSCRANLEFPLRTAHQDRSQIDKRVSDAGRLLHIENLLDRKPAELSGGQRQRVAIGRAIVKEPKVFLFDEPLSNLDAELRIKMRVEIVKLHRQLRNTIIYVTHDQVEALTMADRIVVLRDGRIEQIGTPHELYYRPANSFVAMFIGAPQMNMLPCLKVSAEQARTRITFADELDAILPVGPAPTDAGERFLLGFRPEHVFFIKPDEAALELKMTVDVVEHLGAVTNVYGLIKMCGSELVEITVSTNTHVVFEEGTDVSIWVPTDECHLFTLDGAAIARNVAPPAWQ
jgi:ABC-type sugar transport system ATPase subunit